jgi:hypothetical protein
VTFDVSLRLKKHKPLLKRCAIFTDMWEIIKSKLFLLLAFTLLLLIANCLSVGLFPRNEIVSTYECPDFSRDCEHSHIHSIEDDALKNETIVKPRNPEIQKGTLFFTNIDFKNSFHSQIWQPPKNS